MLKVKDERCLQQLPVCVCVLMSPLFFTFHHAPSSFPLSLTLPFAPAAQGFSFSRAGSTKMCQYVCVSNNSLLMYVCMHMYVCVCVFRQL